MISSIFGKTKPINFVLISVFITTFLVIYVFNNHIDSNLNRLLFTFMTVLLLLVFSILVVDFIAKRNNLTKQNNYVILLYGLGITFFPQIFKDLNVVIANVFVLLAFRRLLSIKSLKHTKLKIFDAAIWLSLATLFYEWAVLYFILLFLVVGKFVGQEFKNWIIPFVSALAVGILFVSYGLFFKDIPWILNYFEFKWDFGFEKFQNISFVLPFAGWIIITLFSIVFYWLKGRSKSAIKQVSMIIILQSLLVSLLITVISGSKSGSEFLFCLFPISVFGTNYLQGIQRKWLKEGILWLLVLFPVVVTVVLGRLS